MRITGFQIHGWLGYELERARGLNIRLTPYSESVGMELIRRPAIQAPFRKLVITVCAPEHVPTEAVVNVHGIAEVFIGVDARAILDVPQSDVGRVLLSLCLPAIDRVGSRLDTDLGGLRAIVEEVLARPEPYDYILRRPLLRDPATGHRFELRHRLSSQRSAVWLRELGPDGELVGERLIVERPSPKTIDVLLPAWTMRLVGNDVVLEDRAKRPLATVRRPGSHHKGVW